MKKVGLYFIVSFVFFLVGQVIWTLGYLSEAPLFGSEEAEAMLSSQSFTLCAIFGLVGAVKMYREGDSKG